MMIEMKFCFLKKTRELYAAYAHFEFFTLQIFAQFEQTFLGDENVPTTHFNILQIFFL